MGVFLVGEAEDADQRVCLACEHLVMQHLRRLVSAAVGNEGADGARLAYKGEYLAAQEELNLIEAAACVKRCNTPREYAQ
jgi:hypothetical protein